jgi:MerR family copper efflux transcriptional regulator
MESQQRYRVSELARLCGVNPRTVDYYTAIGLLTPVARSRGGHRFYDVVAVQRLRMIKVLQAQGLPLDAIRERLEAVGDAPELLARVEALRADLHRLERELTELAPRLKGTPASVKAAGERTSGALRGAIGGAAAYAQTLAQELVDLLNQGGA